MERGQFTFYRSFWEGVKRLSQKDRLAVLEAIIEYGLNGRERELTPRQEGIFVLIRPVLATGRKKARGGKHDRKTNPRQEQDNGKKKEVEIELEKELEKELDTQTEIDRGKAGECVSVEDFFEDFWKMYPVKVGREETYALWQALKLGEREYRQIMASISAWEKTPRWQNEGGRYIPHPAKFLSAGYWKNVPQPPARQEIPKGATGELGQAELENIQRLLKEADSSLRSE